MKKYQFEYFIGSTTKHFDFNARAVFYFSLITMEYKRDCAIEKIFGERERLYHTPQISIPTAIKQWNGKKKTKNRVKKVAFLND